jgi:WD40 repeat protein
MSDFYVPGGTLKPGAPSYIERRADEELYQGVLAGEYCTVLTTRQMGKSSLMARTAARLREKGTGCATVDLQGKGNKTTTPEQWYYGVAKQIADGLELPGEWTAWWKQQDQLPPAQRLTDFFADIVLKHIAGPVVVFVDEVDWTIDLPYSDEFFAAIRSCYNRRATDAPFNRLTFVLLGSASPAQLIKSATRTPFNIGRGIELTDFTSEETSQLAAPLGEDGDETLARILYWTDGHPYLTQMLCAKIAERDSADPSRDIEGAVDATVQSTLLSPAARQQENNLKFVGDRLMQGTRDIRRVLRTYRTVLEGKPVRDMATSPIHTSLRLSGVVKPDAELRLQVRNRVYREVFNERWVQEKTPSDVRLIVVAASVIAAISAVAVLIFFSQAETARQRLSRGLASEAQLLMDKEPAMMERAALLGAESLRRRPTPEGDRVVRSAIGLLPQLVAEFPYAANITTAALNPDGAYVAVAGDQGVDVFAAVDKRKLTHVADGTVVFSTLFSPDGRWLLTGQMDGKVAVFEMPDGRLYRQFQVDAQVTNLVFSRDGKHVAARSSTNTVNVWSLGDASDGIRLRHDGIVQSIAFSLDGSRLCTGTRNGEVYIWEWPSGKLLRDMKAAGPVFGIACGASGEAIAAVGSREVPVWGSTPAQTTTLSHEFPVRTAVLSPDGQYLATAGGGGHAVIWKTQGWKRVARLEHQDEIQAIVFHPSRPLLATASSDRTARIWDLASGSELVRVVHQGLVDDVSFSGDGRRMVTASDEHSARVVEVPAEIPWETGWETGKPTAADFDAQGKRIATGDFNGAVRLWNIAHRELLLNADVFQKREITAIRFSPDERYLSVGTRSGAVAIVDVASGKTVAHFDHGQSVKSITMDASNHWTFTGGTDGKVKIWSLDGSLIATLDQNDAVTGLALSSDGSRLGVTTGSVSPQLRGGFALWNPGSRTAIRRAGSPVSLEAIAFSEDSAMVATVGQDNRVAVWDAASGRKRQSFDVHAPTWAVAFNADGRYLATGSEDRIARVWEISTGRVLVRLPHSGAVHFVRFTRDGKQVLTAGFDPSGVMTQARKWEWQAADLIQQLCGRMPRGLTREDWSRYLGAERFHPVCPEGGRKERGAIQSQSSR